MRSCPTIACEPQTYFRSTLLRFAGRSSTNMCWFSGPGTRDEPLRTSAWEATSQLTSFCLSGLTEKPSIVPPILENTKKKWFSSVILWLQADKRRFILSKRSTNYEICLWNSLLLLLWLNLMRFTCLMHNYTDVRRKCDCICRKKDNIGQLSEENKLHCNA